MRRGRPLRGEANVQRERRSAVEALAAEGASHAVAINGLEAVPLFALDGVAVPGAACDQVLAEPLELHQRVMRLGSLDGFVELVFALEYEYLVLSSLFLLYLSGLSVTFPCELQVLYI